MKCLLTVIAFLVVYILLLLLVGLFYDGLWEVIRWIWAGVFATQLPSIDYPYMVLIALLSSFFLGGSTNSKK